MRKRQKMINYGITGFLIGGTIGSVLTFLFTPKTGRELREDINTGFNDYKDKAIDGSKKIYNGAVSYFNEVIKKADQLRSLTGKYLAGAYSVPKERIEIEIASLKRALRAAINAYNQSPERTEHRDTMVRDIASEFEDETLPKYEGMGHRSS